MMSRSSTTIAEPITPDTPVDRSAVRPGSVRMKPLHPGEYLREEFMRPLGLTAYGLARAIGVPRTRIERIVRQESGITADTALRLARHLGMTPGFWLGLQADFELETAEDRLGPEINRIERLPRPDLTVAE